MKNAGNEKLREATAQLSSAETVKSALSELVAQATGLGHSEQLVKKLVSSWLADCYPNSEGASPSRSQLKGKLSVRLSQSVTHLQASCALDNLDSLYSQYIDKYHLYENPNGKLKSQKEAVHKQLEYIVRVIQSEFGRSNSNGRSFSRSRKDAFLLEKKVKPGPGTYEPKNALVTAKPPAQTVSKAQKKGLEFKIPYSPGPGAYKPLRNIISKGNH